MANITYLSIKSSVPAKKGEYWDQTFIDDMLEDIGESDRHVFIIPGKYQGDEASMKLINHKFSKYDKILVFIHGDEEGRFNVKNITHPDKIVYSQCGNGGFMFPLGYTPTTRKILKEIGYRQKDMNWFFAGQITHSRRQLCAEQLRGLKNGNLVETDGFTKGIPQEDYLESMAEAKTVPCPSGVISVESFRLYEALEAGCIPIADNISPMKSYSESYWNKVFGGVSFPTFNNYKELPEYIETTVNLKDYGSFVFAWWINKKHQIREQLKKDLGIAKSDMVAVVPVSPIKSHPDTSILEETLKSIRIHTDCPIIVTFDGVREEQKEMEPAYREFIKRMLWKINFEYKDILPVIFGKHNHQSGMMRTVLNQIDVPMILYVEQDTPLTPDRDIDFEKCKDYIRSGKSNVIRFHFEEVIPKPHKHLMVGEVEDGFQKTIQWSQRPHLASQEMYRIIMGLFSENSNCFIEDYAHGVLQDLWNEQGMAGWEKWRVCIYHPEGGIKRSYHTDGRDGGKKYDEKQIW